MKSKIMTLVTFAVLVLGMIGCSQTTTHSGNTTKITKLQDVVDSASENDTIDLSEAKYNSITNYNATISKTLTINGNNTSLKNGSLTVTENGVVLSGITNANVTASSSLRNGSLKIANSSLSKLTINGGGINSIVVIDVTVNEVSIDKEVSQDSSDDQYVRFCVNANTNIGRMSISSSVLIDVTSDKAQDATADANKFNIDFKNDNICVAFNNSLSYNTPNGKAKASFALDSTTDADFFIIVKADNKIGKKFFNQVAGKICHREFDPYQQGSTEKFDFDRPITDGMFFTGRGDNLPPPPEYFTVTFDPNGGKWNGRETENIDVTVDNGGTVSAPDKTPMKEGYDFTYWFTDVSCDVSFDITSQPITDNMILYAGWKQTPKQGGITVTDGQLYLDMQTHDSTGDASGDTWTFDVSSDIGVDLSGWQSDATADLYKGSHKFPQQYYSVDLVNNNTVTFKIGKNVNADTPKLPAGTYQLYISIKYTQDQYPDRVINLAGTYDLTIK